MVQYIGSAEGTFEFKMAMYQDKSFAKAFNRGDVIPVGTQIIVKLVFVSTTDLEMFVQNCYASPVQDVSSPMQYKLIDVDG